MDPRDELRTYQREKRHVNPEDFVSEGKLVIKISICFLYVFFFVHCPLAR